jgi:hypothetical protein
MSRRTFAVALIVAAFVVAPIRARAADPNVEEAQRKLEEKAKDRQASRSREVTITQGELDDLKAQIASLQTEVARLRGESGKPASAQQKVYNTLEIGMTKQEVMTFINHHKEYKMVGLAADSGVRKSTDEVTTRYKTNSTGTSNTNVTVDDKMKHDNGGTPTPDNTSGTINRKVDNSSNRQGTQGFRT